MKYLIKRIRLPSWCTYVVYFRARKKHNAWVYSSSIIRLSHFQHSGRGGRVGGGGRPPGAFKASRSNMLQSGVATCDPQVGNFWCRSDCHIFFSLTLLFLIAMVNWLVLWDQRLVSLFYFCDVGAFQESYKDIKCFRGSIRRVYRPFIHNYDQCRHSCYDQHCVIWISLRIGFVFSKFSQDHDVVINDELLHLKCKSWRGQHMNYGTDALATGTFWVEFSRVRKLHLQDLWEWMQGSEQPVGRIFAYRLRRTCFE